MKKITPVFIFIISILLCVTAVAVVPPEIVEKTSVKTVNPAGIRTKAAISTDLATHEDTAEYGFIITRKVFLKGAKLSNYDFTLDSPVYYSKGVSYGMVDGEKVNILFDKNDTEIYFTGYFYGISEQFYREVIVARPYVIIGTDAYYGQPVEMCLYDAAKSIKDDEESYGKLTDEQKSVIDDIVAYYAPERQDMRIVTSVACAMNSDGTYSCVYNLFSPYTGEILEEIRGTKAHDLAEELGQNYAPGTVVGTKFERVEDSYDDSVISVISPENMYLVSSVDADGGKLYLGNADDSIKCKDCVAQSVNASTVLTLDVDENTPVTVITGTKDSLFENGCVTTSSISAVAGKNRELLCYNYASDGTTVYSDYVKVYASADENGKCEYILVIVCDGENAALDEKCGEHTPNVNDPNLIEIMTRGLSQLKKIRISQNTKNDIARDLIVECMTYVLEDANAGIYIDKAYIYSTYSDLAKDIRDAIKVDMTDEERSAFVNILTNTRNIDKDVQDFLIDYFDIDLSAI